MTRPGCDRCGPNVGAYSKARKGKLKLTLCRHHTNKYQYTLITQDWDVRVLETAKED